MNRRHLRIPILTLALLAPLLLLGAVRIGQAHEIPQRVAINMVVHPADSTLQLLVRVPLEALRDVEFPLLVDGSLDLTKVRPLLSEGIEVWLRPGIRVFENGRALPAGSVGAFRLASPSDQSLASARDAFATVAQAYRTQAPVNALNWITREQALLDVILEYPITDSDARFAVEPQLAHLGIRTVSTVRLVLPDGAERAFQYVGDPGRIELDPRWYQAAGTFLSLGFTHILGGIDHLLFVFCLVIPVRKWRPLVAIVSAFTVAHSLTLATAAFGFTPQALWFPPLIETLIAASIVFMAVENVLRPAEVLERRWPVAFAFGLVHGFGFSFALQESLQFGGGHLLMSLAAFNVGVELGQLAVLAVVVPVLIAVAARVTSARALTIVLSAFVAHSSWHWMTERGGELFTYDLALGGSSAVMWLGVLRGALLLAVATAVAWGLSGVFDRLSGRRTSEASAQGT